MMRLDPPDPPPTRALVVFTDGQDIWWLRLLRPGFRHVLVAVRRSDRLPGCWVIVNPLAHMTRVDLATDRPGLDLAGWFRAQGLTVVETMTRTPPRREAPWAPLTCVEVVKRLLGLQARWVLTPFALYRCLTMAEAAGATGAPPPRRKSLPPDG
ncbi:hypothetical protein [Roseospira visakhapatnamensis]|uniref:Uncharacterized protein n=1 Tax=Roseospira visakhapatnamensis TaxID=390880 RepID=A0A7W6RDX1_9PROT|nr:hypothetical protein [Roseospira visakhapatnamensis]MBB4266113.1 hypothetical protein [Roseospira visakhapatnamensis]